MKVTAIFDSLAVLGYRARDQMTLLRLVHTVFDEAIRQLDSLPQDEVKWKNYKEVHEEIYLANYGEFMMEFETKMGFLSHCHSYLDHTDKFHCRCFHHSFESLVYQIKTLLLAKKPQQAYFSYRDIHWKHRRRYAFILAELRDVIKSGRIYPPYRLDKPTKAWLGKIESCKIGMKPTETEKILADKKLMKLIRKARKGKSTSSPYKPLVNGEKEK